MELQKQPIFVRLVTYVWPKYLIFVLLLVNSGHFVTCKYHDMKAYQFVQYVCTEPNRAADWDSVVTVHDNSSDDSLAVTPAHTWHLYHHKIGNHKLISKFAASGARPQVCVSFCVILYGPRFSIRSY